jgi:ubiquinone/menaquinone biosynthesis C-methylase UbiE
MSDDIKSQAQERFGKFAQGYVDSKTHAQGGELARLLELAQPQSDWLALDVATGGGHTALAFAPHIRQVVAYDLTPLMLQAARKFITQQVENVAFVAGDAENMPFADARFDLITCRIAAHHFPDVFKFAQSCRRVLKPGGTLLIQDIVLPDDEKAARYVDSFEKLRDPSHNRAYAEYEWRGTFLDAGLSVDSTEIILKRHEFLPWAQRQGCTPEVIERLQVMLLRAPQTVLDWMQPEYAGTDYATFCNRHLIIRGRRDS